MKRVITIIISLFIILQLQSQTNQSYYVNSKTLNLYSQPEKESDTIQVLKRYQNVELIEKSEKDGWVKIKIDETEGYFVERYLKKGVTVVTTYQIRTGAVCKDGTRSTAIGRGVCSHHGWVSKWLTAEEKSMKIIEY